MSFSTTLIQPLYLVLGAGCGLIWIAGRLLSRRAYARFTVLDNLPALGRPRLDGKISQTAVVCGGSIAGLLSARVLSDHFEKVIIIDPDAGVLVQRALADDALQFPNGKDTNKSGRPRVMQWTAHHVAHAIFFTGLDKLFPALRQELDAADVPTGPADHNTFFSGVYLPTNMNAFPPETRTTLGLTRAATETLLRRLLAKTYTNVRFISGTVLGVDAAVDRVTLDAVRYRPVSEANESETVQAALVVDCSGAASAGLGWLQRAGYSLKKEELVESYHPHMRYTTCVFQVDTAVVAKIKPAHLCNDSVSVAFFLPLPGLDTRHFAIGHVEGDRLCVAAGGSGYDRKITSVDDLRAHVESIQQLKPMEPWVFELLDYLSGEPAETATYSDSQPSAMHRVKYAQHSTSLPSNFVAVGDALLLLNPVNGQGLAKSALEAIALDGRLRHSPVTHKALPTDFGARYFTRVASITDSTWTSGKIQDYGIDSCTPAKGESLELGAGNRWFTGVVRRRILNGDADLWQRAIVAHGWLAPPATVLAPSVLVKLAWDLASDWVSGRNIGEMVIT